MTSRFAPSEAANSPNNNSLKNPYNENKDKKNFLKLMYKNKKEDETKIP
jgi:hypothetical protein